MSDSVLVKRWELAQLELRHAEAARSVARLELQSAKRSANNAERRLMLADERVSRARAILASLEKAA